MEASLQSLMRGLIDYAGLFPPASLDMRAAIRNYETYRKSGRADWLGRFVVPVSRLREFAAELQGLSAESSGSASGSDANTELVAKSPWLLTALIGSDLSSDLKTISEFNQTLTSSARVDTLEMKVADSEAIEQAAGRIPEGIVPYFEIPIEADPAPLLEVIAQAGARAKVRTGGVTPSIIPPPAALARFLAACARAKIPFKATAGLHHPLRSLRPLTYEADAPRAMMHGFLNVFIAAAFAESGMDETGLTPLLKEESLQAFSFSNHEIVWHGHRLDRGRLEDARRRFAIAFGSCSFEEPQLDLAEAGLL